MPQQALLEIQKMRRACDGMHADLDSHRHEGGGNGLFRGYDNGKGGYAPQYCVDGPPARCRQYDD